jgi:putative sterol carrier protein
MGRDLFEAAEDFFLRRLVKKKEASKLLKAKDNTIIFHVSDGEPFTLIAKNGEIKLKEGETENWDLRLKADKNTYLRLFNGEISPANAWIKGKLFFKGIPWLGYPWITRLIKIGQEIT